MALQLFQRMKRGKDKLLADFNGGSAGSDGKTVHIYLDFGTMYMDSKPNAYRIEGTQDDMRALAWNIATNAVAFAPELERRYSDKDRYPIAARWLREIADKLDAGDTSITYATVAGHVLGIRK